MTNFNGFFLGLLQGLTEFLPVSSSGHLTILEHLMGIKEPMLLFNILLHLGSLLAVIIFFRSQIISAFKSTKMIVFIIIATIPTGILGLLIKKYLEESFQDTVFVGITLIFTSIILLSTKFIKIKSEDLSNKKSLFIGLIQGIAVLPGLSRSGLTISLSMLLRISPQKAAEFSFLISIPAILGATLIGVKDFIGNPNITLNIAPALIGTLTAFISGYVSLYFLMHLLRKNKFYYFSFYVFLVGILSIILGIYK